jgi:hypothetical protein
VWSGGTETGEAPRYSVLKVDVRSFFGPNTTLIHSHLASNELLVCVQSKELTLLSLPGLEVKGKYACNTGTFTCGMISGKVVYGFTDKGALVVFEKHSGSVLCVLGIKNPMNGIGILSYGESRTGVLVFSET